MPSARDRLEVIRIGLQGWACFSGANGDDPKFSAFFTDEADAIDHARELFDGQAVRAIVTEHGIIAENDFEIASHEQLRMTIAQVAESEWP